MTPSNTVERRHRRCWPATRRGRLWMAGSLAAAASVLLPAGFVIFSVWVENRFPHDDPQRALFPAAQRRLTDPVVRGLGRQVENLIQRRMESLRMNTGLTLRETVLLFLDERVDLKDRRIHAYRLAKVGSPAALGALLTVFQTAPPEHKAFMAQLMGSTGNPAIKTALWPLLEDPDPRVVAAAIRGLSAIPGEDVTSRLAGILSEAGRPERIRAEAAMGLGVLGTPGAREALLSALRQPDSGGVRDQVLQGLAQFEFSTVSSAFEEYLTAPASPRAGRVAAVEALAQAPRDSIPFLLQLARTDRDAEVRGAAAWAIASQEAVTDLGSTLAGLARAERDPDVRRRLYEALLPQAGIPSEELLPLVTAEVDIAARVAGLNALARSTAQQPQSEVAATFNQELVPELVRIATAPNSLNIQLRAVFALRRARTTAALAGLAEIANAASPPVATAARHGLPPPSG